MPRKWPHRSHSANWTPSRASPAERTTQKWAASTNIRSFSRPAAHKGILSSSPHNLGGPPWWTCNDETDAQESKSARHETRQTCELPHVLLIGAIEKTRGYDEEEGRGELIVFNQCGD